jgi:demethylmenaquinone methyltransferase / 2-methoxy-6-polyprenyl-1,4-benzoquinol methylase
VSFWDAGVERKAFVKDLFGFLVRRYDLANDAITFGLHRLWRRRAIHLLNGVWGRLLDLGGGSGVMARQALKGGFEGWTVICDLSLPMLDAARDRLVGKKVSFVCGDGEKLPFKAEVFSNVLLGFSLRNMPDVPAALGEIHRVLSRPGRIVILETSHPLKIVHPFHRLHLRFLAPALGGLMTGQRGAYDYLRESAFRFPDQKALQEMMREAGFYRAGYYNQTWGITAIHYGDKDNG